MKNFSNIAKVIIFILIFAALGNYYPSACGLFLIVLAIVAIVRKKKQEKTESLMPALAKLPDYKTNPNYAQLERRARELFDTLGNALIILIKDNLNIQCKLRSVNSRNKESINDFLKEIEICIQANSVSEAKLVFNFLKQNEKMIKETFKDAYWDYELLEPRLDCIIIVLKEIQDKEQEQFVNMDYMNGSQFEHFCADVLRKKGYENVEVTKASGDQGVDIIAERDGIRHAIQCKCYSGTVGNKSVQEIYTGKNFYNCQIGIVMTNNYFTKAAKELAAQNGVILWDRDYLNMFLGNYSGELQNSESDVIVSNDGAADCSQEEVHKEIASERENNTYPEGNYIVGTDLPLGRYLIKAKSEMKGSIEMFENYGEFKNDNSFMFRSFSKEFYITLLEEGEYLTVEGAVIQKL